MFGDKKTIGFSYMLSIRNPLKYKDTARLQIKAWRKTYHANSKQKKAGHVLLRVPGSPCGMAREGLEQSTLPTKAELKSCKSLKVRTSSDDFSPISPAQGLAQWRCLLMNCLLRGRMVRGGWSLFTSRCAAWLCNLHWVPVAPAQLELLGPCQPSSRRFHAKERS